MISTKMAAKQVREETMLAPSPADMPVYSYGTSITLDDELLLKLGISQLPPVGTRFTMNAIVEVTSARSSQRQDETESSIELQITDMELGTSGVSFDERASRIYPDK